MNQSVCNRHRRKPGNRPVDRHSAGADFSGVVLAARNAAALAEVAMAVKSTGAEPLICDLDLKKPEAPETLIRTTLDRFGRIDILLNAGAVPQIDLFETTGEQWQTGMALKLHGARRVTLHA